MLFSKFLGLAAAFAGFVSALPTTLSTLSPRATTTNSTGSGSVTIVNHTPDVLYLWSVADAASNNMVTVPANGGTYVEGWRLNPDGGGISIKMAGDPNQSDVLQYEYTFVSPTIWWDLSCINMGKNSHFTQVGFEVVSDNTNCPSAICPAGETQCHDAYNIPTDDHATHGCDCGTHMTLNIGNS
ncbi:hypothetical protein Egran_02116 [Elaphomyces granulatus]|uniref:Uncharacterized protein n=1 Tax=Elaphomyces granulatus TaxID=519963 RepID=A0A232M1A1_9EURO|nr:hypothetical protein Egran_02116 [Elaphomyces granulatus]